MPPFKRGDRVRYDDRTGTVYKRIPSIRSGSDDYIVNWDGNHSTEVDLVWGSDLVPLEPAPGEALVYLRLQTPELTQDDLDRLTGLCTYAQARGYTVGAIWPVHDPYDADEEAAAWLRARSDLITRKISALVVWHADRDEPDLTTREDLIIP